MSDAAFEVLVVEPIRLTGAASLGGKKLMSPYVWEQAPGRFSMLLRVVDDDADTTGTLWSATGDGLNFTLAERPTIQPGPEEVDIGGCEDPTLVHVGGDCLVYYTGVSSDGTAQLLYATGPTIAELRKCGVAHASTASDRNTKEAAVERRGDRWVLLFEYSRDGHSRIGLATSVDPAGPWEEEHDPFRSRPGAWDGWHLSTGPLLIDEPGGPLMFYNGATKDGTWSIGWVRFNPDCSAPLARSEEPLIRAPAEGGPDGRHIAFAASAVPAGASTWLYYTLNDRALYRATVRRC